MHCIVEEQKEPYPYDKTLYHQLHKVENLVAKIKDLALHRNPIRSLGSYLLFGNLHRICRHLPALINAS